MRRSPRAAAFARAWDAARHHGGGLIDEIAFERAIQGVEHEVYNDCGEVVGARLVHDNRLLKYLLSHLKPERYASGTGNGGQPVAVAAPAPALEDSLHAMEPALLVRASGSDDGPRDLSDAQVRAKEAAARAARGALRAPSVKRATR